MSNSHKANWVATVVALIAALTGLVVSLNIDTTNDNNGHKTTQITFKVNRQANDGQPTKVVTVPAPVIAVTKPNLEGNLQDETPVGMTAEQKLAVQQSITQTKATLPPLPTGGATAGFPGCRTQFVVNQSSRHGVRPTEFVVHYTVSPNVPGWADVNSVVNLFNRPSALASSNFVIDGEGHCAYIVPIEAKAWTQAAGNPFSVSVEVINSGKETSFIAPAGLVELRRVFNAVSQRTGIPLRRGVVSNCQPVVSGIINHNDFGICGGGHVDITPYSIDTVVKQLAAGLKPTKKSVWVKHRLAIHNTYQQKCKHKYQRQRRPVTCAKLRTEASKLDKLIARKS